MDQNPLSSQRNVCCQKIFEFEDLSWISGEKSSSNLLRFVICMSEAHGFHMSVVSNSFNLGHHTAINWS